MIGKKNMGSVEKKAVLYTRVASQAQKDISKAIQIQKQQCESLALEEGINITESFSDIGINNEKGYAINFRKLLTYISKEEVDYLLVYSKDRISRSPSIYKEIEKKLNAFGIEILPVVVSPIL